MGITALEYLFTLLAITQPAITEDSPGHFYNIDGANQQTTQQSTDCESTQLVINLPNDPINYMLTGISDSTPYIIDLLTHCQ